MRIEVELHYFNEEQKSREEVTATNWENYSFILVQIMKDFQGFLSNTFFSSHYKHIVRERI